MIATLAPTPASAPQVRTPTPPEPPATTATRSARVKRCSSSMVRDLSRSQRTGVRLAVNLSHSEAALSVWMWSIM